MRRRAFSGPGGAALQAATVAPLLVVIGLGVAELAALARDNVALTSSAREGGRTATTTQADAGSTAISHHAVFPIEPSHRCPDRG